MQSHAHIMVCETLCLTVFVVSKFLNHQVAKARRHTKKK